MEKNWGCILHKHIYSSRVHGVSHQKKNFCFFYVSNRVVYVLLECYEADCMYFDFDFN